MKRRDFLKIGGLLPAALFVHFNPWLGQPQKNLPVELIANGITYHGAPGGEIYTSHDAGRTWQLHTRLGEEYAITGFFVDGSQRIHAQVTFRSRSFQLQLVSNNKFWITT